MGIGYKVVVSEKMLFWTGYQRDHVGPYVRTILYDNPDVPFVWDYTSSLYGWNIGGEYEEAWS